MHPFLASLQPTPSPKYDDFYFILFYFVLFYFSSKSNKTTIAAAFCFAATDAMFVLHGKKPACARLVTCCIRSCAQCSSVWLSQSQKLRTMLHVMMHRMSTPLYGNDREFVAGASTRLLTLRVLKRTGIPACDLLNLVLSLAVSSGR